MAMSKQTKQAPQAEQAAIPKFHFYGTTAFGWATGASRAEVLAKLARQAGVTILKHNAKNHDGLYAWTCVVEAPQSAEYAIDFYRPQGVKLAFVREYRIQNVKGHVTPIDPAIDPTLNPKKDNA